MDATPLIFGIVMLIGMVYLLLSTVTGDLFDFGGMFNWLDGLLDGIGININLDFLDNIGDANLDAVIDGIDATQEVRGFGCAVLAAFMTGFGALGLAGSLSGWTLVQTLAVAVACGVAMSWAASRAFKWVVRQQHTSVVKDKDFVGVMARMTIDTPADKVGEALVEGKSLMKYAVKEVNLIELKKGDYVTVVGMGKGYLEVRKNEDDDRLFI
jgi:hypothetical protein